MRAGRIWTQPGGGRALERALREIRDPLQRARVAGLLADAATTRRAAAIRAEAIYEATRARTYGEVADQLGTGVGAIRKAITAHNQRRASAAHHTP